MAINKKGQVFFYSFMLGLLILVLALAFTQPIKETIDSVRGETNTTIHVYDTKSTTISYQSRKSN